MRQIFRVFVTLLSLGFSSFVDADILEFENGDQLTGSYVRTEDGEIVFLSPMLGELRVPAEAVTLRLRDIGEIDEESTEPGDAVPAPSLGPPAPVAERVDLALKRPRFPEWNEFWEDNALFRWLSAVYPMMAWKNRIELGLNLSYAQADTRAIMARFRTEREMGRTSYLFESSFERTQNTNADGVTTRTRDRLEGRGRIRRTLQEDRNYFVESSTRYNRDLVTRIYHELEQTLGFGYQWLDTDRWRSSVVGSIGTGYREIEGMPSQLGFVSTFFQDLRYQLTERITVSEETNLSYVPTPDDENAYLLRIRAQLESRLNTQLSLNLRYEYYFDERVVNRDARTTQGFTISLGAEF